MNTKRPHVASSMPTFVRPILTHFCRWSTFLRPVLLPQYHLIAVSPRFRFKQFTPKVALLDMKLKHRLADCSMRHSTLTLRRLPYLTLRIQRGGSKPFSETRAR